MSFRFRICKNDTTTLLRKHFNATPMRVPDSSVQPLLIVAEKAGKTDKRGYLKHLLKGNPDVEPVIHDDAVANVEIQKTRSMDWDIGAKLLDGFLQGFNLPGASVTAALANAKTVSLAFQNVRRHWIDKNELGSILNGKTVDLTHPSVGIFLGDDAHNMLMVTDVIVSNGIAINVEKSSDGSIDAKVPVLQQIASDASAKVSVKKGGNNSIIFEGEDFLTFAFSCVRLELNPDTGVLGVGLTVITRESKTPGAAPEEVEVPQPVELDDDLFEPGLLEWD
ncbi:MAG: hypothetical protein Kow0027_28530 [Saprospiraceae bacterium]